MLLTALWPSRPTTIVCPPSERGKIGWILFPRRSRMRLVVARFAGERAPAFMFIVFLPHQWLVKSKAVHEKTKPLRQTPRRVILIVTIASGLAAIGWGLYGQLRPPAIPATATASSPSARIPPAPVELASLVERCERISRPVLLGSRDPRGPSCVIVVRSGDIRGIMPPHTGDPDGGPGTRLATLYLLDRLYCRRQHWISPGTRAA